MPAPSLSYYDSRHDDTYIVDLDDDSDFAVALRYVSGIRRDPIIYAHLVDVPEPHRSAIENLIERNRLKI